MKKSGTILFPETGNFFSFPEHIMIIFFYFCRQNQC